MMISAWKYKSGIFAFIVERQIPAIVDILHDPEVEKYLWFAPITCEGFGAFALPRIEQQRKAFAEDEYPTSATFTISENGNLLGICGIDEVVDGHNVAIVGYQLRRSAWGKGIATCSLEFLLHYAKTHLNVRKLFGDCVAANKASSRVLAKCGFEFEGVIREKYQLGGELHDNEWYGLRMADVRPLAEPPAMVCEHTQDV